MDYKKEDMLDLNEENVRSIFNYCVATSQTKPSDIIQSNFFSKDSNMGVPDLKFSKSRINEKRNSIYYLLGQLKCVHDQAFFADITSGAHKYNGTVWSTNNAAVFSLYYMGCVSNTFPQFRPNSNVNNFLADFSEIPAILPTLSPEDPAFSEWAKNHTAYIKKKSGGQEPADD